MMNRYDALKHAVKAHGAALDKGRQLYILHLIEVADRVERSWSDIKGTGPWQMLRGGASVESGVIVALLHDVWEDTDYGPIGNLTETQRRALIRITRQPEDTYAEYIEKIADDQLATVVKLADLSHNLSAERQSALPLKEQRSLETRYFTARNRLWDALGQEWWPA